MLLVWALRAVGIVIVPLIVFATASHKAALTAAVTTQLCQILVCMSGTK